MGYHLFGRPYGRSSSRTARLTTTVTASLKVVDVDQPVLDGPGHQRGLRGGGTAHCGVFGAYPLQVGADRRRCDVELTSDPVFAVGAEPGDQHLFLAGCEIRTRSLSISKRNMHCEAPNSKRN